MVSFLAINYLGGIEDEFFTLAESVQQQIFYEACDDIEDILADMEHLNGYEHQGQRAFYNDMIPDFAHRSATKETKFDKRYSNHLVNSFIVTFDGQNFLITNTKYVEGANGKNYNLFEDLLWPGFGPYYVTSKVMKANTNYSRYRTRTRKGLEKFSREMEVFNGNLMTYYYRYGNRWFYKQRKRGGMDRSLVNKFHKYVEDAISKGILKAMGRIVPEPVNQMMETKELFEAR